MTDKWSALENAVKHLLEANRVVASINHDPVRQARVAAFSEVLSLMTHLDVKAANHERHEWDIRS